MEVLAVTADCRLCGGATQLAFVVSDRNRGTPGGPFRYVRCEGCEVISIEQVPVDLAAAYPDDYFLYPTLEELREIAKGERYRLEFVQRHTTGGRLTEIGPGVGLLLCDAQQAGYEVAAVDRDPSACEYLRETLGADAIASDQPELELPKMAPSTAVAMWHVIEHLPDPWGVLEAVADNLADDGVVIIAAPNPDSFGFGVLRKRWPHVDAPRHLQLIPLSELRRRAVALGMEEVEVTTSDPGGLHWNEFSWHWVLGPPRPGKLGTARYLLARAAAKAIAFVLRPWERRGLRGAAYTVVFAKRSSSS